MSGLWSQGVPRFERAGACRRKQAIALLWVAPIGMFLHSRFVLTMRHEWGQAEKVLASRWRHGERLLRDLRERGYGPLRLIYGTLEILADAE